MHVDDRAEPRVGGRAVVALEVVLDGDLPVALELVLAPVAEAERAEVHPRGVDVRRGRAERLLERRSLGGRVDEDERAPGLDGELEQADPVLVEAGLPVCTRRRPQFSVEVVCPRVIVALQGLPPAATLEENRPAVAADVEERAQLLVPPADDDHGDFADAAREELPRLGDVLGGTGVLPGMSEDPLLLPRQRLRVGVPAPRQCLRASGGQTGHDYRRRRLPGTLVLHPRQCVRRPCRQSRHGLLVGVASERLILAAEWTSH